jgi:hypothetical protein
LDFLAQTKKAFQQAYPKKTSEKFSYQFGERKDRRMSLRVLGATQ